MSSTSTDPAPCAVCGKSTKQLCGRCKKVHYCRRDCQKQDWKRHKKTCEEPGATPGATCTRCQEAIVPGSKCRIPHPEHLQQSTGSMYSSQRVEFGFDCGACRAQYQKAGDDRSSPISELPITSGPKWCYSGSHTTKPLKEDDKRRISKEVVVLLAGPDLQDELDALDGNESVRVLKISADGDYGFGGNPKLAIRLPNLEELQTLDISMGQIKLTPELTPKVARISLQNPSELDDPDFTITCPELVDFSCYYWGPGNFQWLVDMLKVATKLERFDSYKLRVGYLRFASNHLRSIRLHRAELLDRIDLWAPRLVNLDVQAAYDLQEIHFLKDHPLKKDLPDDFHFDDELYVNSINVTLGAHAVESILAHPRFHGTLESNDFYDY